MDLLEVREPKTVGFDRLGPDSELVAREQLLECDERRAQPIGEARVIAVIEVRRRDLA